MRAGILSKDTPLRKQLDKGRFNSQAPVVRSDAKRIRHGFSLHIS